jgi:hypothetical protein
MSEQKRVDRRSFFQFALAGAVSVPFIINSSKIFAADKCPVIPPAGKAIAKPLEGMGKTLQYVEDAKVSKSPKYKAGANCGNCKFYNKAKEDNAYAPCTMMGMKFVAGCGWCMSYALKA